MLTIDAEAVRQALAWKPLIVALRDGFRQGCEAPVRHHHDIVLPTEPNATLLLMPAWVTGEYIGVKVANVFPGNAERGQPAVSASYLLASGRTGEMLAVIDGGELTARRTAAASALAAWYLAREDTSHLLMVGTGRLAENLIAAHASVRPIQRITVWGRNIAKATGLVDHLIAEGYAAQAATDLAAAVGQADLVCCATLANEPLLRGDWLSPGTHVDLVGGFKPTMREADDEVIRRSRVFVDTRGGATVEAGDIVQPLASGVLTKDDIVADLFELTRGTRQGRRSREEVTLFKSVGAALEDLAAAILAYQGRR
jgi:ornithine cyclodeaminase